MNGTGCGIGVLAKEVASPCKESIGHGTKTGRAQSEAWERLGVDLMQVEKDDGTKSEQVI